PSADGQRLVAVEVVTGPPKSLVLARLIDLKAKKEIRRSVVAEEKTKANPFGGGGPEWGLAQAYFNSKGEPRGIFGGKLIDGTSGKVLHRFNPGIRLLVARDGKCLVRVTRRSGEEKKLGLEVWGLENGK